MSTGERGTVRSVSSGVIKAALALILMAVFFVAFFLTPAIAAGGALLLIFAFEAVRRR